MFCNGACGGGMESGVAGPGTGTTLLKIQRRHNIVGTASGCLFTHHVLAVLPMPHAGLGRVGGAPVLTRHDVSSQRLCLQVACICTRRRGGGREGGRAGQ